MRCMRWLCVLILAGAPVVSFAGDIQVTCEPALRVFLDGTLVGTATAKDDGLFLASVPEGAHVIRVEKDGFVPQTFRVEVRQLPLEVKVGAFIPETVARQAGATPSAEGKRPVGILQVTSAPQDCVVVIDGTPRAKKMPILLIEDLAAGDHPISFTKPGYEPISGVVSIQPGAQVSVRGDLIAGKVENVYEGQGSLRVLSTPEYCKVRFLGKTMDKTGLRLNVSHIPAGEHRIVVQWKRFELSSTIKILDRRRTIVEVSFLKKDQPFIVSYEPE